MLKSVHVYNTYVIYTIIVVIDLCEIYFKQNECVQKKRENIPYVYNAQNYIQNTYSNNLQIIKIVI